MGAGRRTSSRAAGTCSTSSSSAPPSCRASVSMSPCWRLVRLLRVVRLVSVMPDLRILVQAMARSLPPIASLGLLTLLLMYVYGMVGLILFGDQDPEQWGNIGQAILSLFQILTLENWPDFLEAGQAIHPASWIFFVSYVLIASFLVINVLIAIINQLDGGCARGREGRRPRRARRGDRRRAGGDGGRADARDPARRSTSSSCSSPRGAATCRGRPAPCANPRTGAQRG